MSSVRVTVHLGDERREVDLPVPHPPVRLDQDPAQRAAALAAAVDPVLIRAFSDARALLARRIDPAGSTS